MCFFKVLILLKDPDQIINRGMKKVALIVAAGNGSRMNSDIPKQFLLLKNKPVLYFSIKAFLDAYDDIEIILVLPEEHIAKGQEIIDGYFDSSKFKITAGGQNTLSFCSKWPFFN